MAFSPRAILYAVSKVLVSSVALTLTQGLCFLGLHLSSSFYVLILLDTSLLAPAVLFSPNRFHSFVGADQPDHQDPAGLIWRARKTRRQRKRAMVQQLVFDGSAAAFRP